MRASRRARPRRFSTTPTSPARRAATCSTSQLGTGVRSTASGSTSRSRRRRSTSSSGCWSASAPCPVPEELRRLAKTEPGVLAPTSQMRALRELEPPSPDEGFARVQRVPFERERSPGGATACSSRAPRSDARAGTGSRAGRRSDGAGAAVRLESGRPVHDLAADGARLAAEVRGPVETRSARTVAARRSAGAGLRCPGFCSNSRARTTSTRRPRSSSARAPRTGRSPKRSARGTSRVARLSPPCVRGSGGRGRDRQGEHATQ